MTAHPDTIAFWAAFDAKGLATKQPRPALQTAAQFFEVYDAKATLAANDRLLQRSLTKSVRAAQQLLRGR